MKPLNALIVVVAVFAFCALQIQRAKADALDDFLSNSNNDSEMTSIWKSDGSLVNVYGADEAGYVVKGGDDGTEIEYFVKPKDDGSPTFIYDDELIICTNTGCY